MVLHFFFLAHRRCRSNICLTRTSVPEGLGAFCASGAKRQHKMWQRNYQVEIVVRDFLHNAFMFIFYSESVNQLGDRFFFAEKYIICKEFFHLFFRTKIKRIRKKEHLFFWLKDIVICEAVLDIFSLKDKTVWEKL